MTQGYAAPFILALPKLASFLPFRYSFLIYISSSLIFINTTIRLVNHVCCWGLRYVSPSPQILISFIIHPQVTFIDPQSQYSLFYALHSFIYYLFISFYFYQVLKYLQDNSFTDSYISTIGVDFVSTYPVPHLISFHIVSYRLISRPIYHHRLL